MKSLLYVSRRRRDADVASYDVNDIVVVSRARNAALGLTGALVATPGHFAQILEGPDAAVEEVMTSIGRDPRHSDILVAPDKQVPRREFHRWWLAYHGESSYVSGLIAAAIEASTIDLSAHADNIRSLMAMFA